MRFLVLHPVRGAALAFACAGLVACSGSIASQDGEPTGAGGSGASAGRRTGGNGGSTTGPITMPPPAVAGCPVRSSRPPWQLSLHTTNQVRTIVGQVFGTAATGDAQVQSLLAGLPIDLRAKGFDTENKQVSGQYVDAYVALVRRLAGLASEQAAVRTAIESFAGKSCSGTVDLDAGCGLELARSFASALARQPLTDGDFQPLLDLYKTNKSKYMAPKAYAGFVASVLLSARSAMRFDAAELDMNGTVDANALGARLAMTLTSGLPDATLRSKMTDGSIMKADVLKTEAKRLMRTSLGRATIAHFAEQWLNLSMLQTPPGRADYVPTMEDSAQVVAAARDEIGRLFEDAVLDRGGTLKDFYAGDQVVPRHAWLAKQYGTSTTTDVAKTSVADRKGLLTRVAFSMHGAFADYLPLAHRGLGVKVTMLCGTVPPIPDNVDFTLPPEAPDVMSSRQYFETLTERSYCVSCHSAMNPYGYALTGFSVTGARISKETVKTRSTMKATEVAIDEKAMVTIDGQKVAVANASELSAALGASRQGQACFADRFEQFSVGVPQEFLCDDAAASAITEPAKDVKLEDIILAYVASSAFSAR